MKLFIATTLIAAVSAFAPTGTKDMGASSLRAASFEDALGTQPPLGFYDPFGFVEGADQERFDRLRLVELKHGRVSMLAVVGYLITYAGVRFPGAGDIPAGFDALSATPGAVWAQVFFTILLAEGVNTNQIGKDAEFVGDFRNTAIDWGWDTFDDATKLQKRAIELNNGRAAQMGILGLMVHEKLGNVDILLPPSF